jgi:dipeptidase D
MNLVTDTLKPEKLWYHFGEISKIPRTSGNEKAVADYIIAFAQANRLSSSRDDAGNVLVMKPSSTGNESKPVVVLQSHLDMVPEKNEGSEHDFTKDPIELMIDGDWIRAKDTTLGADNGIGVAAMLALLEDESFPSGKLECLFTVEEETGLNGALTLSPDLIEGRTLINLDTEEIGVIYIGCAGGRDSMLELPLKAAAVPPGMRGIKVSVKGLKGGHSGVDIHRGRANAIQLVARLLKVLRKKIPYQIASLRGGDKLNAIPREAFCTLGVAKDSIDQAKTVLGEQYAAVRDEFSDVERNISFEIEETALSGEIYSIESTVMITDLLMTLPHGVITMSAVMDELVETSTNLASVRTEGSSLRVSASHRSSRESTLDWICDIHLAIAALCGARIEQNEGYPGWTPDPNSTLLQHAKRAVKRVTGQDAMVKAIHAGLECGIIKEKYEGMDTVSIGPTVEGAHSPYERVNIRSVETFWEILLATVSEIYGV